MVPLKSPAALDEPRTPHPPTVRRPLGQEILGGTEHRNEQQGRPSRPPRSAPAVEHRRLRPCCLRHLHADPPVTDRGTTHLSAPLPFLEAAHSRPSRGRRRAPLRERERERER